MSIFQNVILFLQNEERRKSQFSLTCFLLPSTLYKSKLNFCSQRGKLEDFIQIVFRVSVSCAVSENRKDKKDPTVMCNVSDVSFAENGKTVFS